jgi:hypothetical protein
MIHPPAQQAQPQHERRLDVAQRLVKIGAVLFRNLMHRRPQQPPPRIRQAIHIADHRARGFPQGQRPVCPPIGGHQLRRKRQCRAKIPRQNRAACN